MNTQTTTMAPWRAKGIGILRIVFGIVWIIDAWFKWQPDFVNNFASYLTGPLDGQPGWVKSWINFWINIIKVDPHIFAHLVAIGETAVAIGLLFGLLSNLTNIVGILLSIIIWTTAEGFGGPYSSSSTDIGAAIIYVLVFAGLFLPVVCGLGESCRFRAPMLSNLSSVGHHSMGLKREKSRVHKLPVAMAGLYYGVDRYLDPIMGRWSVLFSGGGTKEQKDGAKAATPLHV